MFTLSSDWFKQEIVKYLRISSRVCRIDGRIILQKESDGLHPISTGEKQNRTRKRHEEVPLAHHTILSCSSRNLSSFVTQSPLARHAICPRSLHNLFSLVAPSQFFTPRYNLFFADQHAIFPCLDLSNNLSLLITHSLVTSKKIVCLEGTCIHIFWCFLPRNFFKQDLMHK